MNDNRETMMISATGLEKGRKNPADSLFHKENMSCDGTHTWDDALCDVAKTSIVVLVNK